MLHRILFALMLMVMAAYCAQSASAQTPAEKKLTAAKAEAGAKKLTADTDAKAVVALREQLAAAVKKAAASKLEHSKAETAVLLAEEDVNQETLKTLKADYADLMAKLGRVKVKYLERKSASDAAPKDDEKRQLTDQAAEAIKALVGQKETLEGSIKKLEPKFTPEAFELPGKTEKIVPKEKTETKTKFEIVAVPFEGAFVRNDDGSVEQTLLSFRLDQFGRRCHEKFGDHKATSTGSLSKARILDTRYLPALHRLTINGTPRYWKSDGKTPAGWYAGDGSLEASAAPSGTPRFYSHPPVELRYASAQISTPVVLSCNTSSCSTLVSGYAAPVGTTVYSGCSTCSGASSVSTMPVQHHFPFSTGGQTGGRMVCPQTGPCYVVPQ